MNGNAFDDSAEDHFSVSGSSDESEPEHGLTDDSDTDDGEDKRDEVFWFNFDDLGNVEIGSNESGNDQPREVASCLNAVDHPRVTLSEALSLFRGRKELLARVLGLAFTT